MSARRDQIKLWRDAALGASGVELLAGRCFAHRYRSHFHEEIVIAVYSAGAQAHRVGGHRGVAAPGSVLIIPAGETHTGEAAGNDGWAYRAFYPDRRTLADLSSDLFVGVSDDSVTFGASPLHEDARLAERLTKLHRILETDATEPLARQQAFVAAMTEMLTRYARAGRAMRGARGEDRALQRAIECVHARFGDQTLGVAELAAAAELSRYHFMRCFRVATGVTAHAYVVQRRLQEARRLLSAGESAADVASAVGFADQSHLIRRFRSALGVTPGQYASETRKRARPRARR